MGSINQYQATAALGSNPSIQTNLLSNIMGLLAQMNREKKIDDPFRVVHLAGNISRCCGCKGKIVRDSRAHYSRAGKTRKNGCRLVAVINIPDFLV